MPLELIDGRRLGVMLAGPPTRASEVPSVPPTTSHAPHPVVITAPLSPALAASPVTTAASPPPLPASSPAKPPETPPSAKKPVPRPRPAQPVTVLPAIEPDGPLSDAALKSLLRAAGQPKSAAPTELLCPDCAQPMLRRTAKSGLHKGHPFWGCPSFPTCRGKRRMDGALIASAAA